MTIQEINEEEFEDFIKKGKVVVKYTASWCSACRVLAHTYKELSDELKDIKFVELDVDKFPDVAQEYGVMGIPTLILFNNGKEVKRITGIRPKEELRKELK